MLTLEQIISYCERTIAEDFLSGNGEALRRTQLALGVLVLAAESIRDQESAMRLRILAAQAANKQEQLEPTDE